MLATEGELKALAPWIGCTQPDSSPSWKAATTACRSRSQATNRWSPEKPNVAMLVRNWLDPAGTVRVRVKPTILLKTVLVQ